MSSIGEPIPWAAAARPRLFGRISCEFHIFGSLDYLNHNPNPYLFVDFDHPFYGLDQETRISFLDFFCGFVQVFW